MPQNFTDARSADVPETLNASVCIVGAGAAGLTLAKDLAAKVPDVLLVESGGLDLEGETQALYASRNLGLPYFDLASSRLRYFGGTTNHWSGYCRANDPIDYEGRAELNLPPWPVSHGNLEPFIARAATELGIETKFFDPEFFFKREGFSPDDLIDARTTHLVTKVFQIASNIRLGKRYLDELGRLENLRVCLNLNAVHVQLGPDAKSVEHLAFKTTTGKNVKITARYYVLACHAVENARLLLASNDVAAPGIGNQHDHVGRYFMDHVRIFASKFIPNENFPILYNHAFGLARSLNANLGFSDEKLKEFGLLQYYCRFKAHYATDELIHALGGLKGGFMKPGDLDYLRDVAAVMSDLGGLTAFAISKYKRRGRDAKAPPPEPAFYDLDHRIEQAPNPLSRVVLSSDRDALGSQVAYLDWRLSDPDYRTLKIAQDKIASELSALGCGRFELEEITPELVQARAEGHYHNIGTTRMSARPQDGVVDSNCAVHGVSNLYVGGSSVFPTAGYSGPTMMIIGFALRLSDHLQAQLAG